MSHLFQILQLKLHSLWPNEASLNWKTSPHCLLDSLGALSADTRSPKAQCFSVSWIGPGISGTFLRGHIPKYLEWKLVDLKIIWSAWHQGRWKKDRMGPSLGILIKSPPKCQVLNSQCYNQDSDLDRWGIRLHCVPSPPISIRVLIWTIEHPEMIL